MVSAQVSAVYRVPCGELLCIFRAHITPTAPSTLYPTSLRESQTTIMISDPPSYRSSLLSSFESPEPQNFSRGIYNLPGPESCRVRNEAELANKNGYLQEFFESTADPPSIRPDSTEIIKLMSQRTYSRFYFLQPDLSQSLPEDEIPQFRHARNWLKQWFSRGPACTEFFYSKNLVPSYDLAYLLSHRPKCHLLSGDYSMKQVQLTSCDENELNLFLTAYWADDYFVAKRLSSSQIFQRGYEKLRGIFNFNNADLREYRKSSSALPFGGFFGYRFVMSQSLPESYWANAFKTAKSSEGRSFRIKFLVVYVPDTHTKDNDPGKMLIPVRDNVPLEEALFNISGEIICDYEYAKSTGFASD